MKVTCPDAPHLHTAEEVAALLKTTPEAVKGAASHGRIPKTRCGRHVRFSDENIAQIIADGLIPPKGEKTPERKQQRPRPRHRPDLVAVSGGRLLQPRPERARRTSA